ncbi:MAG TPA: hypothetical protein VNC40_03530 [Gaiellaceae bacterium]|nr:hypothetical protein [Gaiellaceae bacterium]
MADEPEFDVEALQAQLAALSVQQFLVSAASTIASLAYAKLDRRELDEARQAIDALAALVPQLAGELAGDLALALTRLQIAYAEAANP